MATLREQIKQYRQRLGKAISGDAKPEQREPTVDELQKAVSDGVAVLQMMQMPGWLVYQEAVRKLVTGHRDTLVNMKPEEFQLAPGLQQKGKAIGAQDALNEVHRLVSVGLEAEMMLQKIEQQALADREAQPQGARRM